MDPKRRHRLSCRWGETWYLWFVFAAMLATCSLSVLPDVRANRFSLADDLERCCSFDTPAITNCSWRGDNNIVRMCHIQKYADTGMLTECFYPLNAPKKNEYPAPAKDLAAQPFSIKCLPKNSSNMAECQKYHNQYFSGLNISVTLSPYTAIFTKGIMISLYGMTANTRHHKLRFCRSLIFDTSPEFEEIEKGHVFFYDGFRWLEPDSTYKVTVRTLPIDEDHNPAVDSDFVLPSCSEVPDSYYCQVSALWQPSVLTVNPDWQAVNVTFDLAPDIYEFDRYCLMLKNADDDKMALEKNVYPESGLIHKEALNGINTTRISTMLANISAGNYIVQLQPRPTSTKVGCLSPINLPAPCKKTGSHVFYVAGPSVPVLQAGDIETDEEISPSTVVAPSASATDSGQEIKMWLPIVLGCIAGILALVVLFFMVHRSKQENQSGKKSKWIWKMSTNVSSDYETKESEKTLQKGLDLTRLREEEFKLLGKLEIDNDISNRQFTRDERQRSGGDQLETLIRPTKMDPPVHFFQRSSHKGELGRTVSTSTLGFTAEFMQVMYTHSVGAKSVTSLGTMAELGSSYRGSLTMLRRHNSKPDLVNMWWEKCPLLTSDLKWRRIGHSCPNIAQLQHESMYQQI